MSASVSPSTSTNRAIAEAEDENKVGAWLGADIRVGSSDTEAATDGDELGNTESGFDEGSEDADVLGIAVGLSVAREVRNSTALAEPSSDKSLKRARNSKTSLASEIRAAEDVCNDCTTNSI